MQPACRPFRILPLLPLLSLLLVFLASGPGWAADDSALRKPVMVESGLLEGVANQAGDVVAFKGVPYAAPPVGNLRWKPPYPPLTWTGIRKADTFGAACTQPASPSGKRQLPMSEDCLFLNIWTPAKTATDKLAILFFIHGGAWNFGSGNMNGEELAKKGIIVISVNYRLGIFCGMGHPELTAESPHRSCGNYGLLDLIAALQWIHLNIGAFGGDPDKITIAGQSSGANAVHYLAATPLAKGLFRGAIGVSFPYDYLLSKHSIGYREQKEQTGLKFAAAKKAKDLAALRALSDVELIADDPAVDGRTRAWLGGGENRDGWVFPLTYGNALDQGLPSDVPTMTGTTADDFGPPAKYMKTTKASLTRRLEKMFKENTYDFVTDQAAFLALFPAKDDDEAKETDKAMQVEGMMFSVFNWAKRRSVTGKTPVYTYLFEQVKPNPEHPEKGASHGSDLSYAFNDLTSDKIPWTEADRRVADQVSSYWANFVKTGDPNGGSLPVWAPFNANQPITMSLKAEMGMRPLAAPQRLKMYLNPPRK